MRKGMHYLVIVDHYSNWRIITRSMGGVVDLICHLRRAIAKYETPEELASDLWPEWSGTETRSFLRK